MKAVAGHLEAESVLVPDERDGQRLHARGIGEPVPGGGLRLSRVEAAHAVHAGRLELGHAWTEVVAGLEVPYLAYADLRDRGLAVRHDGDSFLVWRRGESPQGQHWFRMHPGSERDAVLPATLAQRVGDVAAVVDDDGAVTHYGIEAASPRGTVPVPQVPAGRAHVLADRVVVPGGAAWAAAHLGTVHGVDLVLSMTEAEALRRRGLLDIDEVATTAGKHHFSRTLPVYEALRDAGVVAKSGFRFGTHLRGYSREPGTSHADWIIQCVRPDDRLHWSEISRAVRLAHGVRKTFLLAVTDPVRFVAVTWFRP